MLAYGFLPKKRLRAHTEVELYGDFTNILTMALVLFPHMFQVWRSDQREVIITLSPPANPDNSLYSLGILDKVEFKYGVIVDRISKFLLVPISDVEHIFTHQRGDLMNDSFFSHISVIN